MQRAQVGAVHGRAWRMCRVFFRGCWKTKNLLQDTLDCEPWDFGIIISCYATLVLSIPAPLRLFLHRFAPPTDMLEALSRSPLGPRTSPKFGVVNLRCFCCKAVVAVV